MGVCEKVIVRVGDEMRKEGEGGREGGGLYTILEHVNKLVCCTAPRGVKDSEEEEEEEEASRILED